MAAKIFLRAFEPDDLNQINKWHNEESLNLLTGGRKYFISKEYDRKWLEEKIFNNTNQSYCAICNSEDQKMIGYASLNEIDLLNRNAFWGGILIGDDLSRNKGFASQAAILLLRHAFHDIGLEKVHGKWLSENKVSIFMAKMLGFKEEGKLRKHIFKNNQFNDVLIMSILKEEFEQKIEDLK